MWWVMFLPWDTLVKDLLYSFMAYGPAGPSLTQSLINHYME